MGDIYYEWITGKKEERMKLYDVLKLYDGGRNTFPLKYDKYGIDSRPQTVFKVTLCFMAEEESWLTCNMTSEVLIPWYDCEVTSINPNTDDETGTSLCVWMKDLEYIKERYPQYIKSDKKSEEVEK